MNEYWKQLRYHKTQAAFWQSKARFNICHSGRRSGKSELVKRKAILKALTLTNYPDTRIFIAAPTYRQVKDIYWGDLKKMIPINIRAKISETELSIKLINGTIIELFGMDKPERIEGVPRDHGILDEYGNMKSHVWNAHVRPALSDRKGTCDFIGVPEGRNHYYDLTKMAKSDKSGDWKVWHWPSWDILDAEEIKAAKRDMDELTFKQEYAGLFVNFEGMAYYNFSDVTHTGNLYQYYNTHDPLIFCFDFNRAPGVAAVIQELDLVLEGQEEIPGRTTTAVIGEVFIPQNSNTERVARKLLQDWENHKGEIRCYGDATGGAKGSAKLAGSDWDIIKKILIPHFGGRISFRYPNANPRERSRVNAVNSRLKNTLGEIFLLVDKHKAIHVIKDFEGVSVIKGGTGELDKNKDKMLSHISDAIGYYICEEFPVDERNDGMTRVSGI